MLYLNISRKFLKGSVIINIKVEMHCHSTASDGILSPEDIILDAKAKHLQLLCLTDHDTTDGLEIASLKAKELNLNFIPGIELSCSYEGSSVHVLGYFRDESYKNLEFQNFLNDLKVSRIERAKKIVYNLKKYFDISLDYKKVLEIGKGIVARPHIAKAIIDAGYNYTIDEIFDKFLNDSSPAYVPNKIISVDFGIELLKRHNALVFLAHPKLIKKHLLDDVLKFPFDGIEAIYFQNFKNETDKFISYARYNNLLISCGSDFHGFKDIKHGNLGSMVIDNDDFKKFLNAYNNL